MTCLEINSERVVVVVVEAGGGGEIRETPAAITY